MEGGGGNTKERRKFTKKSSSRRLLEAILAPRWPKSDPKSLRSMKIFNFRVARGVQNGAKIDKKYFQKST